MKGYSKWRFTITSSINHFHLSYNTTHFQHKSLSAYGLSCLINSHLLTHIQDCVVSVAATGFYLGRTTYSIIEDSNPQDFYSTNLRPSHTTKTLSNSMTIISIDCFREKATKFAAEPVALQRERPFAWAKYCCPNISPQYTQRI